MPTLPSDYFYVSQTFINLILDYKSNQFTVTLQLSNASFIIVIFLRDQISQPIQQMAFQLFG